MTETCKWTESEGVWYTECTHDHCFSGFGAPLHFGFRFCPYCGKPIEVKEETDASHVQ
jgi:hypothetical protein